MCPHVLLFFRLDCSLITERNKLVHPKHKIWLYIYFGALKKIPDIVCTKNSCAEDTTLKWIARSYVLWSAVFCDWCVQVKELIMLAKTQGLTFLKGNVTVIASFERNVDVGEQMQIALTNIKL